MKKRCTAVLALLAAIVVIGCASKPESQVAEAVQDAPKWYLTPPKSDQYIYGRGVAKMNDIHMSQRMAETRASVAIAQTLNQHIEAMIVDFTENSGNVGSEQTLNFQQSVSRTMVNLKLSGVEIEDAHMGKDGTYYVLSKINKAEASKQAASVLDQAKSQNSEFKAMDALKEMDKQLGKDNVDSVIVDR